jgi:hypothetical protein
VKFSFQWSGIRGWKTGRRRRRATHNKRRTNKPKRASQKKEQGTWRDHKGTNHRSTRDKPWAAWAEGKARAAPPDRENRATPRDARRRPGQGTQRGRRRTVTSETLIHAQRRAKTARQRQTRTSAANRQHGIRTEHSLQRDVCNRWGTISVFSFRCQALEIFVPQLFPKSRVG